MRVVFNDGAAESGKGGLEQALPRKESSKMKNPKYFFSTKVKHGTRIKHKHYHNQTIADVQKTQNIFSVIFFSFFHVNAT